MRSQFLSLGICLLGLSACGGTDNATWIRPVRPTATSGALTIEDAPSLFTTDTAPGLATSVIGYMDGTNLSTASSNTLTLTSSTRTFTTRWAKKIAAQKKFKLMSVTDACVPTQTPADAADADGDSIPTSATLTYNCTDQDLGLTYSGEVSLVDKDDADTRGGFTADLKNFLISLGSSVSFETDAYIDSTKKTNSYSGKQDLELTVSATDDAGATLSLLVGTYMDAEISPTSMGSPEAAGSIDSLSGFLKASGSAEGTSGNIVLGIQASAGLKYSADYDACPNGFKDGTMKFTDGSDNEVVITFDSACAQTATFNGNPFTLGSGE